MRTIIVVGTLLLFSCNSQEKNDLEDLKQEIIQMDIAMSNLACQEGFYTSILVNADENIVKLGEGKLPIIGKTEFAASFDKDKDTKTISWSPLYAEVAKSGELGYTWGNWKYIARDTVYYGNYFTVWKKHIDGNWKVVLDGGNNTPNPIK